MAGTVTIQNYENMSKPDPHRQRFSYARYCSYARILLCGLPCGRILNPGYDIITYRLIYFIITAAIMAVSLILKFWKLSEMSPTLFTLVDRRRPFLRRRHLSTKSEIIFQSESEAPPWAKMTLTEPRLYFIRSGQFPRLVELAT